MSEPREFHRSRLPEKHPLVPRCATPGLRAFSSWAPHSHIGVQLHPNVSATVLSSKRASFFHSNDPLVAEGRLGKPLWRNAAAAASTRRMMPQPSIPVDGHTRSMHLSPIPKITGLSADRRSTLPRRSASVLSMASLAMPRHSQTRASSRLSCSGSAPLLRRGRETESAAILKSEVRQLDEWEPCEPEAQRFVGFVLGRYRTAKRGATVNTLWDTSLEVPIQRNESIRMEMMRIMDPEGAAIASGTVAPGQTNGSLDWARRIAE